jgi:hypothetical protein
MKLSMSLYNKQDQCTSLKPVHMKVIIEMLRVNVWCFKHQVWHYTKTLITQQKF